MNNDWNREPEFKQEKISIALTLFFLCIFLTVCLLMGDLFRG